MRTRHSSGMPRMRLAAAPPSLNHKTPAPTPCAAGSGQRQPFGQPPLVVGGDFGVLGVHENQDGLRRWLALCANSTLALGNSPAGVA